jgi:hypothetical protein
MYALEIINALNDPDNPAKPKGPVATLRGIIAHRPTQGTKLCLGRGRLEDCEECTETNEQASEALDRREERNISHYSGPFRY